MTVVGMAELRLILQRASHVPLRTGGRGSFRTQSQNRTNALRKLRTMIQDAWEKPKERKMRTGISKAGKARRKADKQFRSKVRCGQIHYRV